MVIALLFGLAIMGIQFLGLGLSAVKVNHAAQEAAYVAAGSPEAASARTPCWAAAGGLSSPDTYSDAAICKTVMQNLGDVNAADVSVAVSPTLLDRAKRAPIHVTVTYHQPITSPLLRLFMGDTFTTSSDATSWTQQTQIVVGELQYHIRCKPGDVGEAVLLPGDPGRVESIAKLLDRPRLIARNREFTTFTGELDGRPVSVTSTGIGSPSTAIAVEELAAIGAKTFLRVGTTGSIQDEVHFGDLVVATAAVRDEGTTPGYVPVGYPAVADWELVQGMMAAGVALNHRTHTGIVRSHDSLYTDLHAAQMPRREELQTASQVWHRAKVLCNDMESSTIFVICSLRGLRGGAVLTVVNEPGEADIDPKRVAALDLSPMFRVAFDALRRLAPIKAQMEIGETVRVRNREGWRRWLETHHADKKEIWVVYFKKTSGKQGITYDESVEEALAYGWIDGQAKTIDDDTYACRFTPRKPTSNWSESNIARVKKLMAEGRMAEAGLATLPKPLKASSK